MQEVQSIHLQEVEVEQKDSKFRFILLKITDVCEEINKKQVKISDVFDKVDEGQVKY